MNADGIRCAGGFASGLLNGFTQCQSYKVDPIVKTAFSNIKI